MRAIWKFPLKKIRLQAIEMPVDAKIVKVDLQYGEPTIWAMVDPSPVCHTEARRFGLIETGERFNEDEVKKYLGSFLFHSGSMVLHLYEIYGPK